MESATATAQRGSGLSAEQIAALKPHIVNLSRGKFSTGGETSTTAADVDAIFEQHLPAFAPGGAGVPIMIYAHGGLVSEAAGLRSAHQQCEWWKSNGVYPIFFVWETGFLDAVFGSLPGARGVLGDVKDRAIELLARAANGERIWGEMKQFAEDASAPGGGALYVARALSRFLSAHPKATVHAVGHSAGSIFHSYFVPAALKAGVPEFASVSLLAPAVRTDTFKATLAVEAGKGIKSLAMYTMTQQTELTDTCPGGYGKSLLYLVRASFEKEEFTPILGLQECFNADPELLRLFDTEGPAAKAEVIWSVTETGPETRRSTATTHGGFDDNASTMQSIARRITGKKPKAFGVRTVSEPWAVAPTATEEPVVSSRRALCIGINAYPAGKELYGCVADAQAWGKQLESVGFEVTTLLDETATRVNILQGIFDLVAHSTAGDVLVVQYAGHGTYVDDLDGDESEDGNEEKLFDEALCPVDFEGGNLIIDDDLGEIFDLLPEGVSLTGFFDSCHSGDGTRLLLSVGDAVLNGAERAADHGRRARFVVPDATTTENFRLRRGATVNVGRRADARELLFSACQPDEVAYETGGHGDFTAAASLLLAPSAQKITNAEFLARVLESFSHQPRQNPYFYGAVAASTRTFLAPLTARVDAGKGLLPASGPTGQPLPATPDEAAARARAAASFLRATADFIDG
ncbi:caspase family protein [Arthrobacter sp. H20]|uniref:caspase family protein n=1 Tax=Arthrobacter sp. H20 TaxID=1267981 RepID=UPI0004AD3CEA|nr:caspase family protein [Arthrobacter sp. H20]